jgi:hypothetical protein
MNAPKINSFVELLQNKTLHEELISFVKRSPLDDHVYSFPLTKELVDSFSEKSGLHHFQVRSGEPEWVIAGSAALHEFQLRFLGKGSLKWTPGDTDIFHLGSDVHTRITLGNTDIVLVQEKTVEELLLAFDLPCCRAAYDVHYNLWISAHCIVSILTRKYNLPLYMKTVAELVSMMQKCRPDDPRLNGAEQKLFEIVNKRIAKYSGRGYGVQWVTTNKPTPWVIRRFHYSDAKWNIPEETVAPELVFDKEAQLEKELQEKVKSMISTLDQILVNKQPTDVSTARATVTTLLLDAIDKIKK